MCCSETRAQQIWTIRRRACDILSFSSRCPKRAPARAVTHADARTLSHTDAHIEMDGRGIGTVAAYDRCGLACRNSMRSHLRREHSFSSRRAGGISARAQLLRFRSPIGGSESAASAPDSPAGGSPAPTRDSYDQEDVLLRERTRVFKLSVKGSEGDSVRLPTALDDARGPFIVGFAVHRLGGQPGL